MNNKQINKILTNIYYNPKHHASYSNTERLYIAVSKKISKKVISTWLQQQRTYTLHKPKFSKFIRNKYDVNNIADLWQADLIDMQKFSKRNKGFNYILAVIDTFSKYGWGEPIKRKTASEIIRAFSVILKKKSDRIPCKLQTDNGKEFTNKKFQKFLKENSVQYFSTNNSETKASIAERYIRTIKSIIFKHFTHTNDCEYITILNKILNAYNNRKHRSIGIAPSLVNDGNILFVWNNLNKNNLNNTKKPKYNVGDHVRITKIKQCFTKGYRPNWTEEVFKIKSVILRKPVVYRISDLADEEITGVFYENELQKVILDQNTEYLIDKILSVKRRGNSRLYLVKWKGYPEKFNSWVREALIKK